LLLCGRGFPTYVAGLQTSFRLVIVYITMKDDPTLNCIF
jgi:hypothetical protein